MRRTETGAGGVRSHDGSHPTIELDRGGQGYTACLEDLYEFACGWRLDVVNRDPHKGFVLLPRRQVVERTFCRLSTLRRLTCDIEQLTTVSETWISLDMA